jgi:predicted Zn-dependent protease
VKYRILILCLFVGVSLSSNPAFGATAKAGEACAKVELKSGSLTCVKVSGKLQWQIVKKAQAIKFSVAHQGSVADKSIDFTFSSSSQLTVTARALTSELCTIGKLSIIISGTPGVCRLSLTQNGNAHFHPAKSVLVEVSIFGTNVIQFNLPGALLLSQGTYKASATSSSKLAVTLMSSTTTVCTIADSVLTLLQSGTCTIVATQVGGDLIVAADPVTQSVQISTSRVTADLPDTLGGFQIKPVYVVPSDARDNSYDTNGYLAGILDEGNRYLSAQIGLVVPVDRTTNGYDIQYLKSQYSTDYLRTHAESAVSATSDASVLLAEIKAMENPGNNRKDYIFFIEVPGLTDNGNKFCGLASRPGMTAVVALQNVSINEFCTGHSGTFFDNYTSKTWVHELVHNFGVDHTTDDPCDLMAAGGTACTAATYTMDKERTRYVGAASSQGSNILSLRVWQGHTNDQSLRADCILNPVARADGMQYAYCPTGTQTIGALTYCWPQINSVELQEQINGSWVSLGTGNNGIQPWGSRVSWSCTDKNFSAPRKELTVSTPGLRHYKWIVNGQVSEELNVIWVN